ncbi:MAG: hypothetical protein KM312_09005 [Hydrogenibacillus schlegelii]|uniref:Sporulation protein YjcZ n=1 Tax=Hydrogenibacillus schlegelii TaxID=1484 RepID=A0A947D290_HYDSH|nr:hypothetical protein [Hydrogenibacillus schlegelii]
MSFAQAQAGATTGYYGYGSWGGFFAFAIVIYVLLVIILRTVGFGHVY